MNNKLLYVIILNYNGGEDTIRCIESVRKSNYNRFKILVVDNGSEDASHFLLGKMFTDIEILQSGKNLGYAGGNNIGIEYALKRGAEYICLLNNDVVIAQDMLSILVENLQEDDKKVVGPAILFWNEERVYSTGAIINFWKGTAKFINFEQSYRDIEKKPISCDYLEGTCLMFSERTLREVGMMPEEYFMYFEETEWCCKAKKKGYDVVCIPLAKLWHKGSASVNKIEGFKAYYENRNRVLFEKRNAPTIQKIFFYHYLVLQTIYRIIRKQFSLKESYPIWEELKKRG